MEKDDETYLQTIHAAPADIHRSMSDGERERERKTEREREKEQKKNYYQKP